MQYPIIDNLIYAYLANGWTGLEIIESNNMVNTSEYIFYNDYVQFQIIDNNLVSTGYTLMGFIIPFTSGQSYTLSFNAVNAIGVYRIRLYSEYPTGWGTNLLEQIVNLNITSNRVTHTFSSNNTSAKYMVFAFYQDSGNVISNIQMEKGTEATPYEPYSPPNTDIKNRLKLPMIHYFPHPVIDALISAADGQHTEEEKEILRHYLTPLGIGGI